MLALMIALVVGHAVATGDSKLKSATGHVEPGTEKAERDVAVAANPNPLRRLSMPRRPLAYAGAESSGRITAIERGRAQLFDVDADRKKRIDDAIDYFGGGTSMSLGRVSANSSRLGQNA
jgi:hypothetical protein